MLSRAIQSSLTPTARKQSAAWRHSAVNAEIRTIVGELEDCLSVTRHLVGAKRNS
jgi:hypothetical protein